jgi:tetratricopeptide (TPR) repeat protein
VIELGRNWPHAYARTRLLKALLGRSEETFKLVEKAIRLSPRDSNLGKLHIGVTRFIMDQLQEAIIWLRRATEANLDIALASACSLAGRREEARAALSQYRRLYPSMTVQITLHILRGANVVTRVSDKPVCQSDQRSRAWRVDRTDG